MAAGERCDACDYSYDLCETVMNCEAGKWRRRALAAEKEAAALRQERDEARQDLAWQKGNVAAERALLTESEADLKEARAALADRDQQLAAAKKEIAHLKQDLEGCPLSARQVVRELQQVARLTAASLSPTSSLPHPTHRNFTPCQTSPLSYACLQYAPPIQSRTCPSHGNSRKALGARGLRAWVVLR